jgi:hypothetical protein
MKKCTWCGKEYPDDATACLVDAQPLAPVGTQGARAHKEDKQKRSASTLNSAMHAAAKKNMLVGGLWCIGGTIVTAVTYGAASNSPNGGSYVVAWGAIIFGAIQFFRGLSAANASSRSFHSPSETSVNQTPLVDRTITRKLWTCAICGEQLEPQFTTCWKCNSPRNDAA